VSALRSIAGYLCLVALAGSILLNAAGIVSHQVVDHVFLPCAAWTVFSLTRKAGPGPLKAAFAGGAVLLGLAALQLQWPSLQFAPYLAIVPANVFLAYLFAHGLLPGRQPALLRLIILMGQHPVEGRQFRRFVAWQCFVWSVMTFGTAVLAMAATVWEPWRADLAAELGWLVAVQVVWFVASHVYAAHRYDRPETCWSTIRAMATPGLWSKLRT